MSFSSADRHTRVTAWLLVETWLVFGGLCAAGVLLADQRSWLWLPLIFAQGCWMHRLYTAGHEAVHRKLVPGRPGLNDALGQVLLLPLLVPIGVYRKIHAFHHGFNRRDPATSALDTYTVPAGSGRMRRMACYASWYAAVFAGGFFIHGLISVVLFLCLPLRVARRVSPAFLGWRRRDQLRASLTFLAGIGLHLSFAAIFGAPAWRLALGWPMLAFAWVYSMLVYIYHYRTSMGPDVRSHARSLPRVPVFSWWLLNFNEHATHHREPSLPWYRLPESPVPPAPGEQGRGLISTILSQMAGPVILEREPQ